VTEAVKLEPDDPALAVSADGERARVKSWGDPTVTVSGAEWVSVPEFPVAVTV
jgi:hypothetical protein